MVNSGLELSEGSIRTVFDGFDVEKAQSVDYEEFLRIIKAKMNEYRVEAVESAFESLNPEQADEISIEYVKSRFTADKHPDVITRKRYNEEVKREFIDSFDEFCRFLKEYGSYGKITKEDFIEYYSHLNLCVEDDNEFADIVLNSWKPIERHIEKPIKQKSTYEEIKAIPMPHIRRGVANVSSIDNTLNLGAKLYNEMQYHKKQQLKSAPITSIMDFIREKVIKGGVEEVFGLFRDLKVIYS
jgi:Ca2+-binding EF-hand superfamily protein